MGLLGDLAGKRKCIPPVLALLQKDAAAAVSRPQMSCFVPMVGLRFTTDDPAHDIETHHMICTRTWSTEVLQESSTQLVMFMASNQSCWIHWPS